jgi:SAM-dependent methyltransferase
MTIAEARDMLAGAPFDQKRAAEWIDLGCGEGVFTLALAGLLPAGSTIHAWDRDAPIMRSIPAELNGTRILKRAVDFTRTELPPSLDGILLANSLHYVKDASTFLRRAAGHLNEGGVFLLAEYDIHRPVPPWVPFPMDPTKLRALMLDIGFENFQMLAQRPSRFKRGMLYTACASR